MSGVDRTIQAAAPKAAKDDSVRLEASRYVHHAAASQSATAPMPSASKVVSTIGFARIWAGRSGTVTSVCGPALAPYTAARGCGLQIRDAHAAGRVLPACLA